MSTLQLQSRRLGVLIAVAAIFVVPPMVRASSTITSSSAPLRLNRGFDAPPSKADVVAGLEQIAAPAAAHHRIEPPRAGRTLRPRLSSVPLVRHDDSPDPLRGPPTSTIR